MSTPQNQWFILQIHMIHTSKHIIYSKPTPQNIPNILQARNYLSPGSILVVASLHSRSRTRWLLSVRRRSGNAPVSLPWHSRTNWLLSVDTRSVAAAASHPSHYLTSWPTLANLLSLIARYSSRSYSDHLCRGVPSSPGPWATVVIVSTGSSPPWSACGTCYDS